jgi:hypothetical protein
MQRHGMHTKLWWVNLLKNGHMEDLTSGRKDDITMNLGEYDAKTVYGWKCFKSVYSIN